MGTTNRGKVGAVKRLIKEKAVQVLVREDVSRALDRIVARERKARRDLRVSRSRIAGEILEPRILELDQTAAP